MKESYLLHLILIAAPCQELIFTNILFGCAKQQPVNQVQASASPRSSEEKWDPSGCFRSRGIDDALGAKFLWNTVDYSYVSERTKGKKSHENSVPLKFLYNFYEPNGVCEMSLIKALNHSFNVRVLAFADQTADIKRIKPYGRR
jgi:hypothetical protein